METYNLAVITKRIYDSKLFFFTVSVLGDISGVKKESTLFSVIKRLLRSGILRKIEKNKYILKEAYIHDFSLANTLYQPSYISFETALNFYGILSQFPREISSSTSRKTIRKIIDDKLFNFVHLKKDLFWGYEKKEGFLIAYPEKALLDQLYLSSKGLRSLDLDECDFSSINLPRFQYYLDKFPASRQLIKTVNFIKKYIKI